MTWSPWRRSPELNLSLPAPGLAWQLIDPGRGGAPTDDGTGVLTAAEPDAPPEALGRPLLGPFGGAERLWVATLGAHRDGQRLPAEEIEALAARRHGTEVWACALVDDARAGAVLVVFARPDRLAPEASARDSLASALAETIASRARPGARARPHRGLHDRAAHRQGRRPRPRLVPGPARERPAARQAVGASVHRDRPTAPRARGEGRPDGLTREETDMGLQVCAGGMLMCTGGAAPSALNVIPLGRPIAGAPAANIGDVAPMVNVPPFAMCQLISNPTVAAATAAALGVLTPMPCVPVPAGTWTPGNPKVLIAGLPALTSDSKLMCAWGGLISVTMPGQFTTLVV
jgi:hypothetical protein